VTEIVHVVRSDGFAGVESFVAQLARAQAQQGDRVAVIGGEPTRMRGVFGHAVPHAPAATVSDVIRALLALPSPPDVLNVHMTAAEVATTLALALRRWRSVPAVVATCHFAARRGSGTWRGGRLVAAVAERRVVSQIAVSRFVAEAVGGSPHVVYPGLARREAPRAPRRPVVLVAQRLEPEKRTEDAVRVFAESGVGARGWRLQIAGDGSSRNHLTELVARLGIAASTDFLGRRQDIASLMDGAAILLAPTPGEGLGLAVLEAMAGGLPVLAAGSGGHVETVGTVTEGQLYANLPDAAARLAALAEDESGRAAYGAALQRAQRERFTLERQVADTAAVYRSAMEAMA